MYKFRGTGVALVTPFKNDFSVDYSSLERLIHFNIEKGIDYFIVMGTTAEAVTLSANEKQQVVDFIIKQTNNRVPLVLGIGGNNTAEVIKTIQNTHLTPFDGILSVSPYYNKPTQEGIYQHFKAIAETTDTPIILYNVPGRTGGEGISPQTAIRLAKEFNHIVAIKEATGDMSIAMELIQNRPEGFLVLSGDDESTLPLIYLGGDGVISVIGEGLPKEFSTMVNHALKGDIKEANALHYQCLKMIHLIFEEGNPAGIKELLKQRHILESNQVRLPLVSATADLQKKINNELKNF